MKAYREAAARKSDLDRTDLAKEKTGVFTGAYAINPVNGEKIPIWISDYVLISYGTGAIMAVPAHDDRDYEFAKKFDLPIIQVVEPPDPQDAERVRRGELCFTGDGTAINSGPFNGLPTPEFKEKITAWLAERGLGKKAVNYKLRDWLFSRQRYWGEPFPILHTEDGRIIGLSEDELPLRLPEVEDYQPPGTGESPLAKVTEWVNVTLPDGTKAKRETNTMPQWAGSCWYYLRYLDPRNSQRALGPGEGKVLDAGGPVHRRGGARGAAPALLAVLAQVPVRPGLRQHEGAVPEADQPGHDPRRGRPEDEQVPRQRGEPGPGDHGVRRRLDAAVRDVHGPAGGDEAVEHAGRAGRVPVPAEGLAAGRGRGDGRARPRRSRRPQPDEETLRLLHQTIHKVGGDIETFGFNTAISAMMIFVNHLARLEVRPESVVEPFILILAPFAPHIAEELWQRLGHTQSLAYEPWPQYDEELAREKQVELAVQVNGKVRDRIVVAAEADEEQIKADALASEKVVAALAGKTPKKVIVIKARLVNIVV